MVKLFKIDVNRLEIPWRLDAGHIETVELQNGGVKINVWSANKTIVELYVNNKTRRFNSFTHKTEVSQTPTGTYELIPHIFERELYLTLVILRSSERCFQGVYIKGNDATIQSLTNYKEINEFIDDALNEYY